MVDLVDFWRFTAWYYWNWARFSFQSKTQVTLKLQTSYSQYAFIHHYVSGIILRHGNFHLACHNMQILKALWRR